MIEVVCVGEVGCGFLVVVSEVKVFFVEIQFVIKKIVVSIDQFNQLVENSFGFVNQIIDVIGKIRFSFVVVEEVV